MKRTLKRLALLTMAMVLGFASCEKGDNGTINNDNNGGAETPLEELATIVTDSVTNITTSNLILTELNKYSKDMLLDIKEDYTITYKILLPISSFSKD